MKTTWISDFLLFATLLILAGCAGRSAQYHTAEGEQAKTVAEGEDSYRAEADSLWELRLDSATAVRSLTLYKELAAKHPGDRKLIGRVMRAYYYTAWFIFSDQDVRDSLYSEGIVMGEQTLGRIPEFKKALEESEDEFLAIAAVTMDDIEILYWYAVNFGKWASTKSLLVRLKNKKKIVALNDRVLKLDENYFYGAPHRFFGVLPTKVPGGDMDESKKHFEKSIAIAPDYFGTRTMFAEGWATRTKNKAEFEKQLNYVIEKPADVIPDLTPENTFEQQNAKKLLARSNEFFD